MFVVTDLVSIRTRASLHSRQHKNQATIVPPMQTNDHVRILCKIHNYHIQLDDISGSLPQIALRAIFLFVNTYDDASVITSIDDNTTLL